MPSTQVPCPSCGVILKPKRPVAAGQQLRCPRCATMVEVPGAAAVGEPDEAPAPVEGRSRTGLVLLLVGLAAGVLLVCCGSSAGLGLFFYLRGSHPGDSLDAVLGEEVRAMNDMADVLATVQDQASAQRTQAQLKAFGPRVRQLRKRESAFASLSPVQQQALKQKYEAENQAAVLRLSIQVQRVRNVPGGREVLQELKDQVKDWPGVANIVQIFGGV
jgi:hypothetical protein